MKYILIILFMAFSFNSFAQEILEGGIKLVSMSKDKHSQTPELNTTIIHITGKAAQKLYQDMKVKEVKAAESPYITKFSKDRNLICDKDGKEVKCSIWLNSSSGEGLSKETKDIVTPCGADSDTFRNNVKDIEKAVTPMKKSPKATEQ